VVAADFLPDGNKLYMLVADSDCNLHHGISQDNHTSALELFRDSDVALHVHECNGKQAPVRMTLFGKDPEYLEVVAADFLPDGNKLYMLVADSDG
jgi:hypothetical protein